MSTAAARAVTPPDHIAVTGLAKRFGAAEVYSSFDIAFPHARVASIFGPNGCGKSTLINILAGILRPDAGRIEFDGQPQGAARIGYVFQNYRDALFPWLRAIDNIRYPLKFLALDRAEETARVDRLLALFDVKIDLKRYPYELSGGQQQFLSIMRALVVDPEVLLLDEPFSALDYEMTLFMRDQLQRVLAATRTTTLLVSHDLEEAIYLADRVVLLSRRPARIADVVEVGLARPRTPETLSHDRFVALKRHCLTVFQAAVRGG